MSLKYKFEPLPALKAAGFSTYTLRQRKLFAETTIQKLRKCEPVGWENLDTLCRLLKCQPGDLLEYVYVPEEEGKEAQEKHGEARK